MDILLTAFRLVRNTPLINCDAPSETTECLSSAMAEFLLNPGGSVRTVGALHPHTA